MKQLMQKITPFLWFNNNAEEAVNFYISVFKDSSLGKVARYGDAGPGPKGQLMTADFKLNGQEFIALNGGPHFTFNEAISFVVNCKDQQEVDYYWDKLSEGGQKSMCGWLKDKFGLSWQVVPSVLPTLIGDPDVHKAQNVMRAMMKMQKIVIRELEEAYKL
jgi:predicted 3-demethylubiquinone-9 3-methyltransferase (glyoxalase superfamily)